MQVVDSLTYEGQSCAEAAVINYGTTDKSKDWTLRYAIIPLVKQWDYISQYFDGWDFGSGPAMQFTMRVGDSLGVLLRGKTRVGK